MHLLSREHR